MSTSPPPIARPATLADVPEVARVLARAFDGYPWTAWTVDARDHRRRLTELYALFARLSLAQGELWVTDDLAAAAAWQPPAASRVATAGPVTLDEDPATEPLADLLGDRAAAAAEAEALVAAHRPEVPHWYLGTVGTDPARQGEGLGRRVLAPVLARADASGVGAATETSAASNLAFYARLDFAVTGELTVPGGPRVWLLWRPPAPRRAAVGR